MHIGSTIHRVREAAIGNEAATPRGWISLSWHEKRPAGAVNRRSVRERNNTVRGLLEAYSTHVRHGICERIRSNSDAASAQIVSAATSLLRDIARRSRSIPDSRSGVPLGPCVGGPAGSGRLAGPDAVLVFAARLAAFFRPRFRFGDRASHMASTALSMPTRTSNATRIASSRTSSGTALELRTRTSRAGIRFQNRAPGR